MKYGLGNHSIHYVCIQKPWEENGCRTLLFFNIRHGLHIPNFFVCQFSAYKHRASQITCMQIACMPKSAYKVLLNISQNHSSKEHLNYFRRASVSVGWSGDLLSPHTLPAIHATMELCHCDDVTS